MDRCPATPVTSTSLVEVYQVYQQLIITARLRPLCQKKHLALLGLESDTDEGIVVDKHKN